MDFIRNFLFKPDKMKNCIKCNTAIGDDFKFCPECGSNQNNENICNNCSCKNEPGAKFCYNCGTNLLEDIKGKTSKKVKIDLVTLPEPTKNGITIEFAYTTAQSFDFAVQEAKKFETFEQFGSDKKSTFRVTLLETKLHLVRPLTEQLKGWRNKTVYYNGEKVKWDTIFEYANCFEIRQSSYKPEYYCFGYEGDWEFNIWGCTKTKLPFTEYSPLFTFGKWLNKQGDWQFDKERIRHELMKNIYGCRFCPAINIEHIKDILETLPNIVNPNKNKNWKFVERFSAENNSLLLSTRYEMNTYAVGVCPNGKGFINDISNNIKNRIPEYIRK